MRKNGNSPMTKRATTLLETKWRGILCLENTNIAAAKRQQNENDLEQILFLESRKSFWQARAWRRRYLRFEAENASSIEWLLS